MLDVLAAALAAVQLAVQQRDRLQDRRDRQVQEIDLHGALVELHELAYEWSRAAVVLNRSLKFWQMQGFPAETESDLLRRLVMKQRWLHHLRAFGAHPALRELKIYAPQLGEQLDRLSRRSESYLQGMVKDLDTINRLEGTRGLSIYVREYEKRTREVQGAVEDLRVFISTTFPP